MKLVEKWAIQAGLRLYAGKTQAIILGSAHNIDMLSQNVLPCIEMEKGVRVPFVGTVKNLDVILDPKFTWKLHINLVSSKVNRALYSLTFFRFSTTEALRKLLANALVPHILTTAAPYTTMLSRTTCETATVTKCVREVRDWHQEGRAYHAVPKATALA